MVRSKEVPKKPKDPLLTPPSKPRGFSLRDDGGFGGSLPRNRGGAAMSSPAAASVPNYMRATNSSGAKAGQRQRAGAPSSASASTPTRQRRPVRVVPRGKVLFPAPAAAAASPGMVRPTCSSTLKGAKFPGALDLAPGATDAEGPAAMRVCPYTYCSLNGHAHAPAVPLRSFLATRRRLIKTQQSMKHKGVSAFRRGTGHQRPEDKNVACPVAVAKVAPPLVDEEALGDFFVEVYTGPRVSSGTSCSDMSLDEVDAAVRSMEFVVFDRCGAAADDDKEKGDLAVHGDGEARPCVCRDSSSECGDTGISGNLVEELPWMSYQGYECDSLDDDVSEQQGVILEEIGEAEDLAEDQEGEDEEGKSGGLRDEGEEEADEEQKSQGEDEEIISDLLCETGIIAEEEGVDCRVDKLHQQEASTGQETQHPGEDEESVSDVVHQMKIAPEQSCAVCPVEVCKEQEEETILSRVCQGDISDGQGTSEEKFSDGVCESEVPEYELSEMIQNVLEDTCKEENLADQEAKDDEINMDYPSKSEIAEKQEDGESEMEIAETVPVVPCIEDFFQQESTTEALSESETSDSSAIGSPDAEIMNLTTNLELEISEKQKDAESEMEISETFPDVACRLDFCEKEATSGAVSEGEISYCSVVGSPDVEICNQPTTNGGFEQDVNTIEDALEQYGATMNSFEQLDATAETTASGTKDAEKGLEITTCKSKDGFEEAGITQESSQDFNSVCVDAPAKMEPEITDGEPEDSSEESGISLESCQNIKSAHVDNGAQIEVSVDAPAQMKPEITECKLEESSEESSIPQESSQSGKSALGNNGSETEIEFTTCKLEESSEESSIPQESSQSGKSALGNNGSETEIEFTTCKLEDPCEESGIAQEVIHDGNSAYLGEGAQMQLGNVITELEDTSEESDIAQEIGEDNNSAYVSDVAQNGSEITTCELDAAAEAVTVHEADQGHNCADISAGAQNEFDIITVSELANPYEGSDVTQEAIPDDNTTDVNDGPGRELETMACKPEHAHEELDITREGDKDDCADGVCAGALKEMQTSTCETKDVCEEVCITEDPSATDSHGEPQNLPAEDNDVKEFSVDDMCSVFSGMNLKGDVYVDPTESEISPRKRLIIAGRRRTPEEEEYMRGFNPRAPNFLPLELDPDSEKVDLKHQTAEDRKNAEEWMIDYALRRVVNNLGPARKKKVELLVQAFETVLPHDEDEKKNTTPTRAVQACN